MGLLGEFCIYFISLCQLKAARAKHEDLVFFLLSNWLGSFICIISLMCLLNVEFT